MKTKYVSLLFVLALLFTFDVSYARYGGVSDYFYTNLSPHGKWIEMDYGFVAWRPYDSFGRWTPYSRGKWIWTDYGWYWDSRESYGHIVYHYGRWHFDDYYGWIWIPDYEWAPAWVEWRYDDDYIGWAPLSPYGVYKAGFGIHYTNNYSYGMNCWNFVAIKHFYKKNISNYFVGYKYRDRIYNRTTSRTDYSYNGDRIFNRGIEPRHVERAARIRVNETRIVMNSNSNGRRDAVTRSENRIEIRKPADLRTSERSDLKFERSDRKVSLELNKVEIGRGTTSRDAKDRDNSIDTKREIRNDSRSIERREPNRELNREASPTRQEKKYEAPVEPKREPINERRIENRIETERERVIEKRNDVRDKEYREPTIEKRFVEPTEVRKEKVQEPERTKTIIRDSEKTTRQPEPKPERNENEVREPRSRQREEAAPRSNETREPRERRSDDTQTKERRR